MKSIVIIIDYFGQFPEWFQLYLESCRLNPTINWLFHTDCVTRYNLPSNVKIVNMSWVAYQEHVSVKLGIRFQPCSTYKICDIRPAVGHIWEDEIRDYDFFGWGDVDLLYGNIRNFYTADILNNYRVLSINKEYLSGPLCLLKNEKNTVMAYTILSDWQRGFESATHYGIDEYDFRRVFYKEEGIFHDDIYTKNQFCTPLEKTLWENYGDMGDILHDDIWYWKHGNITSKKNGDREFICIHFMNYVKGTWLDESYGKEAPWKKLPNVVNLTKSIDNGVVISLNGIESI